MIILDLGQSGARAIINGELHQVPRGKLAGESVLEAITAIAELLPQAKADLAALSLTGLFGIVDDPEPFHQLSRLLWGVSSTVVIDDGLASFCGAVGGNDGVALTLGGGVVAVGGRKGIFSHADGLGSIFGDEGSGYWLGVRGLTRALATVDGRDSERELLEFLNDEVDRFDQLEVKNSSDAVSLAISSAEKVLAAADAGVDVAISIRNEGAIRLAQCVAGAWSKAGGERTESPVIAISGGLSRNLRYVEEIMKNIERIIPSAVLSAPLGNNLDGARWIAENMKTDVAPLMKWSHS